MTKLLEAISNSDDFAEHKDVFLKVSEQCIQDGEITLKQLQDMGGWVRSDHPSCYFCYVGEINDLGTNYDKIYLNIEDESYSWKPLERRVIEKNRVFNFGE